MKKKDDLPAMPFYVGDWLKAPEVRAMPPDYRGLWFDCLCYMWESTERGYLLKPNGKPYSKPEIIRMIGLDNQNSELWLTYILENEVCSVRETDGAIYSRKMVKDEEVRKQRKIAGSKGGNPILVKGVLNPQVKQFTEDETETEDEDSLKENVPAIFTKRWNRPYKNNSELHLAERLVLEFGYKATDDAFRIAGERGDKTSVPYVRGILNKDRMQKEAQGKSQQRFTSPIMEEMYGKK